MLSGTKLIKPAALSKASPKSENCLASPKTSEDPTATDSCAQFQTVGIKFHFNIYNFYILKLY